MADEDLTPPNLFYQAAGNPEIVATSDPLWNTRVRRWLLLDAVQRADYDFGPMKEANDPYDFEGERMIAQFGKTWETVPEARDHMRVQFELLSAAEEARVQERVRPMWNAAVELATTPAPTLAALLFKVELIKREGLDNDLSMPSPPFEIITAEAAAMLETV